MFEFICDVYAFIFSRKIFNKFNKFIYFISLRGLGIRNYKSDKQSGEADFLKSHPEVRTALNKKRLEDTSFAKSADQQLEFVYNHSPWIESAYLRYPVYRVR